MIGKNFQQFKIIRELGRGGLGIVYLAHDEKLDRKVALKFLRTSADSRIKILHEARAAGQLNHPGIVTIHDVIDTDDGACIVMEYIEGESLEELLHLSKMPISKSRHLAIKILEIIDFAHKSKLIHGDLKPTNIIIDKKGNPKLLDFGLAGIDAEPNGNSNTSGTFPYLSPEQIMGMPGSEQSDLYSFGVILYQLFTGNFPFQIENQAALIFASVNQDPKQPKEYNSSISDRLNAIILKCLDKNPQSRFVSAGSLLSAISELEESQHGKIRPYQFVIGLLFFVLVSVSVIYLSNSFFNKKAEYIQSPSEVFIEEPVSVNFTITDERNNSKNANKWKNVLLELLAAYFSETANIKTSGIHDEINGTAISNDLKNHDYGVEIETTYSTEKNGSIVTIRKQDGRIIRQIERDWTDIDNTISLSQKIYSEVLSVILDNKIILRQPAEEEESLTRTIKAKSYGIYHFQDKNYELALNKFNQILADDPENLTANYYKGLCLKAQGKYNKAIEAFSSTLPGLMIRNFIHSEKNLTNLNGLDFIKIVVKNTDNDEPTDLVIIRQNKSFLLHFFNLTTGALTEIKFSAQDFGSEDKTLTTAYFNPEENQYILVSKDKNKKELILVFIDENFKFIQARRYKGNYKSIKYPYLYINNNGLNQSQLFQINLVESNNDRIIELPKLSKKIYFNHINSKYSILRDKNKIYRLNFEKEVFKKISDTLSTQDFIDHSFTRGQISISHNDSLIKFRNLIDRTELKVLPKIKPDQYRLMQGKYFAPYSFNPWNNHFFVLLPDTSLYLAKIENGKIVYEYSTKLPELNGSLRFVQHSNKSLQTGKYLDFLFNPESGQILCLKENFRKLSISILNYGEHSNNKIYQTEKYLIITNSNLLQIYDNSTLRPVSSLPGNFTFIHHDKKNRIVSYYDRTEDKFLFFHTITAKWISFNPRTKLNTTKIGANNNKMFFINAAKIFEINLDNLIQDFAIDPATVYYHMAFCYYNIGQYENSLQYLQKILTEIQPNSVKARALQLKVLLDSENYPQFLESIHYASISENPVHQSINQFRDFLKDKNYIKWETEISAVTNQKVIKIKATNKHVVLCRIRRDIPSVLKILDKKSGELLYKRVDFRILEFEVIPNEEKIIFVAQSKRNAPYELYLFDLESRQLKVIKGIGKTFFARPKLKYYSGKFYLYNQNMGESGFIDEIDINNFSVNRIVQTNLPFFSPLFKDGKIHFLTKSEYYQYNISSGRLDHAGIDIPLKQYKIPNRLIDLHQGTLSFVSAHDVYKLDVNTLNITKSNYKLSAGQTFNKAGDNKTKYYYSSSLHRFIPIFKNNIKNYYYTQGEYTLIFTPFSVSIFHKDKFKSEIPLLSPTKHHSYYIDGDILYIYGSDMKLYALDLNFILKNFKKDLILALK